MLIEFRDRAIPDDAPWSFLNRQNYITRKILQKQVCVSAELIKIEDYLKTLSSEEQDKYKDDTLNGSIVKMILLSSETVTLPCFSSAYEPTDEFCETDKLKDITININSESAYKQNNGNSKLEFAKQKRRFLICLIAVLIIAFIIMSIFGGFYILNRNHKSVHTVPHELQVLTGSSFINISSDKQYLDFKSTINVDSYEQYKSFLSDCEKLSDIRINLNFLNVSQWSKDFVPLCVNQTVALSLHGNLYTRTVFQLMNEYSNAQIVNISAIIIDSYDTQLEHVGNISLPKLKHFVFQLRSPDKIFNTLFTSFSMPNMTEIDIQGILMNDVAWKNFQLFIGFSTTLKVVRLGGYLLSRTVFVKSNKLHSVSTLELSLGDLSDNNSFVEIDRSYICWAFPNLTNLYSQNWRMSLEVIKTCNSLETLNLTIQNDNGKVLDNIGYFEYNHPALLYAEIYLTYSSSEKCPRPGITTGVSSKQFDTSLQIYSDKCEPNVLNIGGRVYEE